MRIAIALLLVFLLQFGTAFSEGSSHGIEGHTEVGCTCHGSSPGVDAQVLIEGIPSQFTAGEEYTLKIVLEGGPAAASAGHQGGFNLRATGGEFRPLDASTQVMDGEITHEHSGANQRQWEVAWEAPSSEKDVTFFIAGNIVNGDHEPSDADDWALNSYASEGQPLTLMQKIGAVKEILLFLFLFVVPGGILYWRSRK